MLIYSFDKAIFPNIVISRCLNCFSIPKSTIQLTSVDSDVKYSILSFLSTVKNLPEMQAVLNHSLLTYKLYRPQKEKIQAIISLLFCTDCNEHANIKMKREREDVLKSASISEWFFHRLLIYVPPTPCCPSILTFSRLVSNVLLMSRYFN